MGDWVSCKPILIVCGLKERVIERPNLYSGEPLEHIDSALGKGEVVSSILTGSTTVFDPSRRHVLRDLVADKESQELVANRAVGLIAAIIAAMMNSNRRENSPCWRAAPPCK